MTLDDYPFGLKHKGYNNVVSSNGNSTAQKFGYNGVELEESLELNLMEMDLRQYDPAIGRWTGIDPITHHSMSTYTAFDNNPVFWADPSGADAENEDPFGRSTQDKYGNYLRPSQRDKSSDNNEGDKSVSEIADGLLSATEDGGRSGLDFNTGETSIISAKDVTKIFEGIVQAMNELLQNEMWNAALVEVYPLTNDENRAIYSKLSAKTIVDLKHIDKMIGRKPISSFWGAVTLDGYNNVIKGDFGHRGSILVNYMFGTGSITGFKSTFDKNGDPTGIDIVGMGQSTVNSNNPYGIIFTKGNRSTNNWIGWRNNKGKIKFWNFYKNLKAAFIKQFKDNK
ncbi:MAG: RHS repeat-associated core domain-containing protein [Polaribacter sp.]|uniref:RHS repeat-associated core domain-containing protein n=1 Tax=Polaribacter sp. TaxID=1920175 RepID=UPI002F357D13